MPDLTPPPMSDAKLWKVYNAWRRDHECDTTFDLMQMAIAARDEQWRKRLEAVPDYTFSLPSGPLLYRIKEQG